MDTYYGKTSCFKKKSDLDPKIQPYMVRTSKELKVVIVLGCYKLCLNN